jgi:hypothetical protein
VVRQRLERQPTTYRDKLMTEITGTRKDFSIEMSDGSTLDVSIVIAIETEDEDSIAQQQLQDFRPSNAMTPLAAVIHHLLIDTDQDEETDTEPDGSADQDEDDNKDIELEV